MIISRIRNLPSGSLLIEFIEILWFALIKIPTPLLLEDKLENQQWPPHWEPQNFSLEMEEWVSCKKNNIITPFMEKTQNWFAFKTILQPSTIKSRKFDSHKSV